MADRRNPKTARGYVTHIIFLAIILITAVICVIAHFMDSRPDGGSKELAKGDLPALSMTSAVTTAAATVTTTTSSTEKGVPKSKAKSEDYLSSCVFVGDSITVGLSSYQFLPAENVIAEVGINIGSINDEAIQTAYGDLTALQALMYAPPENVYVMLGSNGIAWLSLDSMIEDYSEFLESVRRVLPDAKIYVMSIPPVTAAKEKSEQPILNSAIDEYNKRLLEFAEKNKYYFIDLNAELKGEDGTFPQEYAADDGMHFNRSTYEKMIDFILTHVA